MTKQFSPFVEKALQVLPIQDGYYDVWGNFFTPSEEGMLGILRALRFDPGGPLEQLDQWQAERNAELISPAIVLRGHARRFQYKNGERPRWILRSEEGREWTGFGHDGHVELPRDLADGYYDLDIELNRKLVHSRVIVCPDSAFSGPERRSWGLSTQLYSLHSGESEGLGDFQDLKKVCAWVRSLGGGFVGVNPLHALFPQDPIGFSPYSPSSRRALNPLYIHLEALPEFHPEDLRIHQFLRSRHSELLNYPEITERKFQILARCYARLIASEGKRRTEFAKFVESADQHLRFFARHEAKTNRLSLDQVYSDQRFHLYCQWAAFEQLRSVKEGSSLEIGLYLDLAVGVNPQGAEVHEDPALFASGASAGAPPDLLNVQGQVWGLAPYIPWELRKRAYEPFIQTLRFNMQFAGALRIDHIMSLQRLFWVSEGMSGREGIYLQYPLQDLIGVVALESQRNRCVVIGEDLGTVPDEIRAEMSRTGILSYKVLYFMKDYHGDQRFLSPEEYPEAALVTESTHDLPTLRGFLQGQDLAVRLPLNLFSETCTYHGELAGREKDRERLVRLLAEKGFHSEEDAGLVFEAIRFLAGSRSRLQSIQLEDLIGELDQANLPGTVTEHPNWRRRLSRSLESIFFDEGISGFLGALRP